MALTPGTRLGVYDITAQIGEGGMGAVYRATDTSLGRQVAIKVLPDVFAQDAERLARFEREAKTLAALNHPNIAAIYGLERSSGTLALVMELVEGEDLSQRIAKGAIPLDEALPIAKQIAEALEAAHEQGIIHRDLKPANIKVRPNGTVKVLDFGLAKAMEPVNALLPALSQSPTITTPAMTQAGMILGTAAYMSPEQARGKNVDRRTDIWAFGCVLFEMLAARRPFDGDTPSDVTASTLTAEPAWERLPPETPPSIRKLLTRCLQKEVHKRLPQMAVAVFDIDDVLTEGHTSAGAHVPSSSGGSPAATRTIVGSHRAWLAVGSLIISTLAIVAILQPWRAASRAPTPVQRLQIDIGADVSLDTTSGPALAISPDGQTLALVAHPPNGMRQLYVRRLDRLNATPIPGTAGAYDPFFSPDGRWIGYFAPDTGNPNASVLKKVALAGGAPVPIVPALHGAAWTDDNQIIFSSGALGPLLSVSANGGAPKSVTSLADGEQTHRWGQLLPGGKAVLFTAGLALSAVNAALVVQSLPSGPRKVIQNGATYGRYLPSGHVVYVHDGTLFGGAFDLNRLEFTSPIVPLVEGVSVINSGGLQATGAAQFALTSDGALAYVPGKAIDVFASPIVWMERGRRSTVMRRMPSDWSNLRFSPDGRQIAMDINQEGHVHGWLYDWTRDALFSLTSGSSDDIGPMFTPDGRGVAFGSTRGGPVFNIYWQPTDAGAQAVRLTDSPDMQFPTSWHPGGRVLAFNEINPKTSGDVMLLPMERDSAIGWKAGTPAPFQNSPADEWNAKFSPDGKWLAYLSNESGRYEVYVRPFPGPGGKFLVSNDGAAKTHISWSANGRELLYVGADQRIMSVSCTFDGSVFHSDRPRVWSELPITSRARGGDFDLNPDGRVAAAPVPDAPPPRQDHIVIVSRIVDELQRLAPVAR